MPDPKKRHLSRYAGEGETNLSYEKKSALKIYVDLFDDLYPLAVRSGFYCLVLDLQGLPLANATSRVSPVTTAIQASFSEMPRPLIERHR